MPLGKTLRVASSLRRSCNGVDLGQERRAAAQRGSVVEAVLAAVGAGVGDSPTVRCECFVELGQEDDRSLGDLGTGWSVRPAVGYVG